MLSLVQDYQLTALKPDRPPLSGLDSNVHSLVGWVRYGPGNIGELLARADRIDALDPSWRNLADNVLRRKLLEFKEQFRRRARGYQQQLPQALAAVREAASRRIGLRPYPVQLVGALGLYEGYVAEMATGEGKTLTAALTSVLNGWSGLPCHVITVNDYLAERDFKWMRRLYDYCGLSSGVVIGTMDPEPRRAGYRNDVVYTTNKEIVADFLRDRLWLGKLQHSGRRRIAALLGQGAAIEQGIVMRGIHSAIVDEADSILIDEAVTPLIISRTAPNKMFLEACRLAHEISGTLRQGSDYEVNHKYREIILKPRTRERLVSRIRGSSAQFRGVSGHLELIHQALTAREFFKCDQQYIINDDRIVIVDEFTGRQMPQRTWQAGLHQFVEANENLAMTSPTETLARLSFQRFYRLFKKLAGMTGTAREATQELWDIYQLPVVSVPENRPCQRGVYRSLAFADQDSKWRAIVEEIGRLHSTGRPILVGTRSVEASEHLASLLEAAGLWHKVLNAVRHKQEAAVIALAGESGAITIATNMAGRGTDIRLGRGVAELGGLHVIASECHEAERIDRQLYGRCARQGDPGSCRLFVSMEDEIIRRQVPAAVRRVISVQLRTRPLGMRLASIGAVRWAQAMAQRVALRRRRGVLRTDTWLDDSLSFAHRDIS